MSLLKRLKAKALKNEIKYIIWRNVCLLSGEGCQGVSYYMKRTLCKLLQDWHYLSLSTENLLHFLAYQNRAWYTPSLWFIHLELRMLPLQEAWFPLGCMFFLDELHGITYCFWEHLLLFHLSESHAHTLLAATYMKSFETSLFRACVRKKRKGNLANFIIMLCLWYCYKLSTTKKKKIPSKTVMGSKNIWKTKSTNLGIWWSHGVLHHVN